MERTTALDTLKAALVANTVPAKDKEFVSSLVTQSSSRGLSEKQWYWVAKLAARMAGESSAPAKVADFAGVYAMFAKAQEHLKHPKIHLSLAGGYGVKLYVSTARSRVPNVVNIVDEDGYQWFGRVHPDGSWERGTGRSDLMPEVEATLRRLAADPEGVASEHGRLTGACCFCNRSLKDERSTDVGYGPVCARNFNLRWGD